MTAFCVGLLAALALPAAASDYLVTDFTAQRTAEYLMVVADDFADDCDALLAHREAQGRSVSLVRLSDIRRATGDQAPIPLAIVQFLKAAHEHWQTRFVLLVGDARGESGRSIPMSAEPASYYSPKFLSEQELVTDYYYSALGGEQPVLHVGRFPADTRDELATMIAKTIAYETAQAHGPWQRKLSFLAGKAGFGELVDAVIESQFTQIVLGDIPPEYDIEIAHARTASNYCPFPPRFNANAVKLLNEGSLFYVYVGHGTRTGCDDIEWQGEKYPIFDSASLPLIDIPNGLPVMAVIACDTARIDSAKGDSIGEEILKLPRGPVAYLGSTRICQPYGNALLGRGLVRAAFASELVTLGEVMDRARSEVLSEDDSPFRKQADAMAGMLQGAESPAKMRRDVVRHYNLLGDPALVLQRPGADVTLEASQQPDGSWRVKGTTGLAEGEAIVTFEAPRNRFAGPLPELPSEGAGGLGEAMAARYRAANDKRLTRAQVLVEGGTFATTLEFPEALAPGHYAIKAFAWHENEASAGALSVTIDAP